MTQPAGSVTPANFGYRIDMFGYDGTWGKYFDACCYVLTRLQEGIKSWARAGTTGLRPYHAHQGYVEDETPNLSMDVRYFVDEQPDTLFVFNESPGDDYGTRTFSRSTPAYPFGYSIAYESFTQQNSMPRYYCLEIRAHSNNPDSTHDDHTILRGGIIEHTHDSLSGFETKGVRNETELSMLKSLGIDGATGPAIAK